LKQEEELVAVVEAASVEEIEVVAVAALEEAEVDSAVDTNKVHQQLLLK
jgi:hypothetical protein